MNTFEMGNQLGGPTQERKKANLQRDFQLAGNTAKKIEFLVDPSNREFNRSFVDRKVRELTLPERPGENLAELSKVLLEHKSDPALKELIKQFIGIEDKIKKNLAETETELGTLEAQKVVLAFALENLDEMYPDFTESQRRSKKHAPRQIEILAEKAGRFDVAKYIKSNGGEVHFKKVNEVVEKKVLELKLKVKYLTTILLDIEELKENL
ncbi:MAG: hypothetical protein WCT18_00905 [Patescibacteria group bacterium]